MKNIIKSTIIGIVTITIVSCSDFINLQPISNPTIENYYTDLAGLKGAVNGSYDAIQQSTQYGSTFMTLMEVRSDNIFSNNPGAAGGVQYQVEVFTETSSSAYLSDGWYGLYNGILRCNLIIESAPKVVKDTLTANQLTGQAYFIRALSYFNLVRLWGKVPLITKSQTASEARNNSRSDIASVYQQIVNDLTIAKLQLPKAWANSSDKGRATSYAASALLAKAYLYQNKWSNVVSELQPLVDEINKTNGNLALVPQTTTFPNGLKTSKDIIFAVYYLNGGVGESADQGNRYRDQDNSYNITLSQTLFEPGDNRAALVVDKTGDRPLKFRVTPVSPSNETSGDFPVLRCAEVMLMYAEAKNEITYGSSQALAALNAVRTNAGIVNINPSDQASFRTAVYKERRLELALECDRWFDILRTGQFPSIFPGVPAYRMLYPVPQGEIDNVNDKTGWKNDGY